MPVREEQAEHLVARLEPAGPFTHRDHLAGAIRHRDTSIGGRDTSHHHHEIMVVQAARLDANEDFAAAGFRVGPVFNDQVSGSAGFLDCSHFHRGILLVSSRGRAATLGKSSRSAG